MTSNLRIAALLATLQFGMLQAFRVKRRPATMQGDLRMIGGVPVYNHHLAYLARNELRGQGIASQERKKVQVSNESTIDWLLMLKPNISDTHIHSFCDDGYQCPFEGHSDGVPFVNLEATENGLEKLLRKHPGMVEFVEPDLPMSVIPDDPTEIQGEVRIQAKTWGLNRIGAATRRRSGAGAHVYILDTGIRYSHTQFRGHAKPAVDTSRGNLKVCGTDTSCAYDRHGHGTHCAGTVGGKNYGVAPGVSLWSAKVMDDQGRGPESNAIAAMDWIIRSGKKPAVISMSLRWTGQSQALNTAVNKMVNAGITVVVAAGNDQADACNMSPAFVRSAITVGSIGKSDQRSGFSNYGSCVNVFAPGEGVYSAHHTSNTATKSMDGTSMACPHVAGAAALLLASSPSRTPKAVLSKIQGAALKNKVGDARGSTNLLLQIGKFR